MTKTKKQEFIHDVVDETATEYVTYSFEDNLPKYVEMIGFFRWYPDHFLDLLTPPVGGINLHLDQRVFLRALVRFYTMYGVFSRSYGKTAMEVWAAVVVAIMYPNITISITAQTKENAAKILSDKWQEMERYWPLLKNELLEKPRFSKNSAEIKFLNGSVIDVLANSQSSKGQRRHRLNIEESALMDNSLFDDALAPVVDNPRSTSGKYKIINPQEMHRQINFFSTSWYRASFEYSRMRTLVNDMIDLKGAIVLGASWQLGSWYGRGADKSTVKKKSKTTNPIMFDMNYCSRWVGVAEGGVVDMEQFMSLRTIDQAIYENDKGYEMYMGVDVARSDSNSGVAQTSVVIARVRRKNGLIYEVQIPFITTISGKKKFEQQAKEIKRLFNVFDCRAIIIDSNGLGKGLTDKLLEEDDEYGAWSTMNSDVDGQDPNAPRYIYDLKVSASSSGNSDIIVNFMGLVSSERVKFLVSKETTEISESDIHMLSNAEERAPYIHTDFLVGELNNLQLKTIANNRVAVQSVINRIGKDRFSATIYVLWYITTFEKGNEQNNSDDDVLGFAQFW